VGTNPATVLSSRSNDPEQAADSLLSGLAGGPLPWLPGIPDRIAANLNWGPFLDAHHTWSLNSATRSTSMPKERRPWAHAPLPAELEGSGQAHPCISLNVVTVLGGLAPGNRSSNWQPSRSIRTRRRGPWCVV
jgi:hypothetical protein